MAGRGTGGGGAKVGKGSRNAVILQVNIGMGRAGQPRVFGKGVHLAMVHRGCAGGYRQGGMTGS